jgi:hypothetical protein
MNRFKIKKHKLDDGSESSVGGTSSGSIMHSTVSVRPKTIMWQYNKDYLSFGFISSREEQPCSKCVVCGETLTNQSMVPSLHIRHSHLGEKPAEYIKRLIAD